MGGTLQNTEPIEKTSIFMKRNTFLESSLKNRFSREILVGKRTARGQQEASKRPEEARKRPARGQEEASNKPATGQQEATKRPGKAPHAGDLAKHRNH